MKEQCRICGEFYDDCDMVECFYCGRTVCRDCTESYDGISFMCAECEDIKYCYGENDHGELPC